MISCIVSRFARTAAHLFVVRAYVWILLSGKWPDSTMGVLGAVLETSWALWGPSCRPLGRSWGGLGGILGGLRLSWALWGRSWRPLGRSWGGLGDILGTLGRVLGALGTLLGVSWVLLGRSWRHVGRSKCPKWRLLGAQDAPKSTPRGVSYSEHEFIKKYCFFEGIR